MMRITVVTVFIWIFAAGCSELPLEPSQNVIPVTYNDDHGDTPATATLLVPPSVTPGRLDVGDIDYFRIDIWREGLLIIRTTGGTDTQGYLHGDYGTEIFDDDRGAGYNFRIDSRVYPGTYYVEVYANSDTGHYTLRADLEYLE